jgi:DNA-binding CsgD family transcriptional regulator
MACPPDDRGRTGKCRSGDTHAPVGARAGAPIDSPVGMVGRLHERERELGEIERAIDEVAAGAGRVLVVEGPAGIGKTRLLESARDAAHAHGFAVASARGSELELAFAWGIVRQLLEPRLRGMPGEARARALAGAASLAAPIVVPDGAAPPGDADPSSGVLHGLYWLVAALAVERPQLLVVDDLHWSDGASVRLLEFLANRIDTVPALLLAAQRPWPGSALRAAPAATWIELSPLSSEATAAVVAEHGDTPVSTPFAEACHVATGGNPLLIHRLAQGLRERGIGGDDADAVTRLGPYAVAGAVGAALARLGEGPVRLAEAVAVLERAPLATAARLAAADPEEAWALAEELVRAGILRDARPLAFAHGLVRDAVLSGLTAGERARLHAGAARILRDQGAAPEAIAVHLLHTEPGGDEAVANVVAEAGRRALASGALSEAVALLERAVTEPPPAGARSALLLDLARAEHGLGRPGALDGVLAAYDAGLDEVDRAQAALALMWATGPGGGDPQELLRVVEEALRGVAGRHRELELRLESCRLMASLLAPALMEQAFGQAERFAELEGRTAGECELLLHVAMQRWMSGRPARDVADPVERAVADPRLVAEIGSDSAWLPIAIGQLFKTDRLDAARRTMAVALAEAQRRGSAPGFAAAMAWHAWIALRVGAADDAEADARAACEAPSGDTWQHLTAACSLVDVLVERGELDAAQAVLGAAGGEDGAADGELLLSTRSNLRAAQGDAPAALADQLEARRLNGGMLPDPDFDGWLRIARLHHAVGDGPAAGREAGAALDWARAWGTPGHLGQALVVSGLISGDLAQLHEAVAELERSPARRELARALVELGAALRRGGERRAAREPLRRALDLAAAGGMVATAERARAELRVTGAKVHREESTGLESLTPSERRIARLAADGASNPEIAQALFVTVKTVEMHLGNAYRKLGIGSRRDLAALMEPGKLQGAGTGSPP